MKIKNLIMIYLLLATSLFCQFGDEGQLDYKLFLSQENAHPGSEFKVALDVNIFDTWHINSNKPHDEFLIPTTINIKSENLELVSVSYPEAEDIKFDFSENPVSVFEGNIKIIAVIKVLETAKAGTVDFTVDLEYQACNNKSCMPPSSVTKSAKVEVVDKSIPVKEINSEIFSGKPEKTSNTDTEKFEKSEDESLVETLESSSLIVSLLLVYLGGLALNLTPCVYPLIPITVGYFGGQSEGSTGKLFSLGLFYVLGMAITYSIVGVITSLSGAVFGSLMQNPFVIGIICMVFIALAVSMFGVYELKMPDKLVMKAGGAKSGVFGALFMGLTMGIVAAPCIGPFVLGLVTAVAKAGDPVYGFMMFFFLALGLGTPYLFLAIFSGKIKNLPRAGFWMNAVKRIFGYILIGMAIYFAMPLLPKSISSYILPVYGIIVAVILLFIDKLANDVKGFRIFKIVFSIVLIIVSTYMLWPVEKKSPEWKKYSDEKFEASINSGNKMIIDVFADWCIPCKEFDALTFSDDRVIKLSKGFDNYKIDLTKSTDETDRLKEKFGIVGAPTIIFFNSKGEEAERLTGFVNAEEFLKIMKKIN